MSERRLATRQGQRGGVLCVHFCKFPGHGLGRETEEGAVRALGLPMFDASKPVPASIGFSARNAAEGELDKGKAKEERLTQCTHLILLDSSDLLIYVYICTDA